MSRLFVAVWPDVGLVGRLRLIDRPTGPGLRWTTEDQWHVTLCFLGEVDPGQTSRALDRAFDAPRDPIVARAGPRPVRLSSRVLALPVSGLDATAAAVAASTSFLAAGRGQRPFFRGHLTLARARERDGLTRLETPELAHDWPVKEITLVTSELHRDGARYEVIGSWLAAVSGRAG